MPNSARLGPFIHATKMSLPAPPTGKRMARDVVIVVAPLLFGLWASFAGQPHPFMALLCFLLAALLMTWFVLDFFGASRRIHFVTASLIMLGASPFILHSWREKPPGFPTSEEIADAVT